jgi:hypothetical protein
LLAERKLKGLGELILTPGETRAPNLVNWNEFLDGFPRDPLDYFDRAILNLSRIVRSPTKGFDVTPSIRPLLFVSTDAEAGGMFRQLLDQGLVGLFAGAGATYCLSAKGWKRVAQLNSPGRDSRQAFVAMWFDPTRKVFFDHGFQPAIEADGKTNAFRIDRKEHNQKIDDEIVAEIRRSRYLVADFTGNRGGVYFEAWFALGLGLPVIWCVEEGQENDLHFDTRQFNHITYTDPADLKTKLLNRIRATIV